MYICILIIVIMIINIKHYIYIYICMYVCMYVYIYIYIYIASGVRWAWRPGAPRGPDSGILREHACDIL